MDSKKEIELARKRLKIIETQKTQAGSVEKLRREVKSDEDAKSREREEDWIKSFGRRIERLTDKAHYMISKKRLREVAEEAEKAVITAKENDAAALARKEKLASFDVPLAAAVTPAQEVVLDDVVDAPLVNEVKPALDLDEYLAEIARLLDSEIIIDRSFESVARLIPTYETDSVLHQNDIKFLAKRLGTHGLRTEPKLSSGFVERAVDAPLFFYKDLGEIDFNSKLYKFARLVTQVAVIMARADHVVVEEELNTIQRIIWKIKGISHGEKVFLLAKAKYLLVIGDAYDEKYRDYIRIALSKENALEKMRLLSNTGQREILNVAKDIAIADGFLCYGELKFIKDMYHMMELPLRRARKDIEEHAENQLISLKHEGQEADMFGGEISDEVENVLGDLFEDFNF